MACKINPAPPIHAHSRYARITSDVPSETGPAYLENLGYNGGGDNGGEPAFSIVADHTYSVSLAVRPVHGRAELSVGVVDRYGLPLTSITRLSYIVDSDPLDDTEETGLRQDDGADAQDSGVSISPDSSDGAIVIGRDGWYRFNADVTGLNTDYGKLRITIDAGERTTFDLDLVQFMDADYWGAGDPKWRYGKLRRDLVETIQALHPAFLRFPGGCIVEGVTPGNEYRWKDTVGSLAARRQQYSMWSFKMPDGSSYSQSYQIGFYEYFCLCEDLKAKPLPTLFAGIACQSPGRDPRHMDINSATFRNNVIQDYLDLIEFANGDPESSSCSN